MKPAVLIVGDRRKIGVSEAVAEHMPILEQHLDIKAVDLDEEIDLGTRQADLVLVFGGDGSILHVSRRLGRNPVPVLGVNYGHFGFLTDLEPEDLDEGIRAWLAGDFVTTQRSRLLVRVLHEGEERYRGLALNDVVVGREGLGRIVEVRVRIDERRAVTFSGDGLIVATATGSTAHSLAAGGPLMEPTADTVLLVPIAPHALSARPLVLAAGHRIQLFAGGRHGPGGVTVDGMLPLTLARGECVDIQDAQAPLTLVHPSGRSFYDALRRKLGWRGRSSWHETPQHVWEDNP